MNFEQVKKEINKFIHNLLKGDEEKKTEQRLMTPEEKLDERVKESFPASDPPARNSFTGEVKQ